MDEGCTRLMITSVSAENKPTVAGGRAGGRVKKVGGHEVCELPVVKEARQDVRHGDCGRGHSNNSAGDGGHGLSR